MHPITTFGISIVDTVVGSKIYSIANTLEKVLLIFRFAVETTLATTNKWLPKYLRLLMKPLKRPVVKELMSLQTGVDQVAIGAGMS